MIRSSEQFVDDRRQEDPGGPGIADRYGTIGSRIKTATTAIEVGPATMDTKITTVTTIAPMTGQGLLMFCVARGSLAINRVSLVDLQAWMGHADIKTTMRYLHHKSHAADAVLLDGAFSRAEMAGPRSNVA